MSPKSAASMALALTALIACSVMAKDLPEDNLQPSASNSRNISCERQGGGWRVTGNAPGCCLALASGKCMFTCGPGSPRCEGGTHNLPSGQFDLTNLPTEPDGTINLQTFCAGQIPGRQVLNPPNCQGGEGAGEGTVRWTVVNGVCCPSSSSTYSITIDGITRRSTIASCDDTDGPTVEDWARTSPGSKSFSGELRASTCGDTSVKGNVTFAENACYVFMTDLRGQDIVSSIGTVDCSSTANAASSATLKRQVTPMAIYPLYYSGDRDGLESYQQIEPQSRSLE